MALSPLRKVLIGVGIAVAATAATLTYLAVTFDANAYKGIAIDWMKDKRDRTLAVDGPVSLSFFPRLTVKLSGVTLSERGRPAEFAHVDDLSLSVAVLPLLGRRLEVDRVSARGVRFAYRRTADGVSNIDDLLARSTDPRPPADDTAGKALQFDVSGIRVDDLKLDVHDDLAKVQGKLAVVSFETGRLADGVASPVALDAQVALTAPAATGRLSGKTTLTPDLKGGGVVLRDMALAWTGDAFGAKALDTRLTGALAYDRAAGTVSADDLALRFGVTWGDLKLVDSRVDVKTFAYDPARKLLALNALEVRLNGQQRQDPLALAVDWPQLTVTGDALTGGPLSGSASMKGATAIDMTFKSGPPRGNFQRIEVPALELTLKGRSGPHALSGTVRSDLQADVAAGSLAIDALVARLTVEEPSLQPLKLQATGRASASASAAQWTLKGDINTNPFESQGRVGLTDKPVSVDASASFQSLDLNRLLPAAAAKATDKPAASGASGDAAPVDLSALRSLQGKFRFQGGTFAYGKYRATRLSAAATLSGGVLRAAPVSAGIWGGTVDGAVTADANTQRIGVKASANGVDVQRLLKDVADKDLLEGTGRVTVDVTANGRTVGELQSHLNGSASLLLRDGAIKGVNLAQKLRQAKAALSMRADAGSASVATEKTDFSELSASFAIASGVARSSDLSMKSPFLRLGGDGAVDIPKARIDYTVRATVTDTSKGQGGADLADLRGITVPVQLTGPLNAIAWNIRWSAVAADLLKSKVGQQVEDRLKDKLNEKLGLPPRGASAADGAAPAPEGTAKDRRNELLKKGLRDLLK